MYAGLLPYPLSARVALSAVLIVARAGNAAEVVAGDAPTPFRSVRESDPATHAIPELVACRLVHLVRERLLVLLDFLACVAVDQRHCGHCCL